MLDPHDRFVALVSGVPNYEKIPDSQPRLGPWPEYPFPAGLGEVRNSAYEAVRKALLLLRLDESRVGWGNWNPLGDVICPGDTVVLKPNFVRDFRESSPDHADCLITHGAIIRAAADFAFIALRGRGRIIIADAPQNDADFAAIRRLAGLDQLQQFYRRYAGFNIEVYDLRPQCARKVDGVIVGHMPLPGDPAGYVSVNLGQHSAFTEINHLCDRLYGAEYDMEELHRHQHGDVHEYLISRTVLDADCVISLPKLKTHKKTGLTANLKNLVGINGNKNWLPHHREGTPRYGGDQFADDNFIHRLERLTVAQFKRWFPLLGPARALVAGPIKAVGRHVFGDTNHGAIRSGNWYGNDTTWRMVLDLNRVLLYADADGKLHKDPVHRFFSIVEGITAGEGNGPLDPTPKPAGVVLAGTNALAVDMACARVMGFDYRRIPMLSRAFDPHALPLAAFEADSVTARCDDPRFDGPLDELHGPMLGFTPHFGWEGHVEINGVEHETRAFA